MDDAAIPQTHAEQVAMLAMAANHIEKHPADAAAMLIDAAAMLACEAGPGCDELVERFRSTVETMASAREVVEAHGAAAAHRQ